MVLLQRITTEPTKLNAVREYRPRRANTKFRSFLSPFTYCRRFISGFANIIKSRIKITEENQDFQWIPEVKVAFETLKETHCTLLILFCP
jgi:hypothetical protein